MSLGSANANSLNRTAFYEDGSSNYFRGIGMANPSASNYGVGIWALSLAAPTDSNMSFFVHDSGNVGIGTSTPTSKLYVAGSGGVILNAGNVGIGTTNPQAALHVASSQLYYIGTFGYLVGSGATGSYTQNGNVSVSILASQRIVASEYNATSDRRVKEEIKDISDEEALKFIDKSRPVHFRWQTGERNYNFGFVAQEVDKLGFHELVSIAPDESMKQTIDDYGYVSPAGGKLNMNYSQISAILTRAMQVIKSNVAELVVKLTGLDQRLQNAEQENRTMRLENDRLKKMADKAETESAQIKARLDLLMKVLCEKDRSAIFCY